MTYEGSWVNDFKQGEGKQVMLNGNVYIGNFDNNMRHGHGKLTTANSVYTGEFVKDKKEGKGKQFSKNNE